MKFLLINTRIVAIALVTVFAVAFSVPALANQEKNEAPVALKYLGTYKNLPAFEVTFNYEDENEFIVTILDENKNVLYRDIIKSGTTSKKYLLNTEEAGDATLQFEITGKKTNKTTLYQVNRSSRVVEDMVVNKIK